MEQVRLGFDATAAAVPRPTGVGLCVAHLARALSQRHDLDLTALVRLSRARKRAQFLDGLPARLYHERWSLRLARRLDVVHGPDTRLPRFAGPARVATVHDLSARRPGFSSNRFRKTREAHWSRAAQADLIVTYTDAVRREVARELPFPRERIAVVPLAPTDALARPPADAAAVTARLVGQRPYVLCLGELSARKNTVGALEAFAAADPAGHALVLAGPRGRGAEAVDAAAARLGLGERLVRPDYLPAADLAALLHGASALLFPTRYEGFGMPVLEAFRAGVPVVTSLDPAVTEVAGGAALQADADDVAGLARALTEALADPAPWIARGRTRVASFSWETAAARLSAVYRAAAAGAPAPSEEASPCAP